MKSIKLVSVTFALALTCSVAQAQVGRRLQDAAGRAAERAATQQTERRVEDAVDKTIDGALDGNNNQQPSPVSPPFPASPASPSSPAETPQQGGNALEMAYAKNDFVPGDEIIFEDDLANEKLGEFPSQWDLLAGEAQIASMNGEKCIVFEGAYGEGHIAPLMKDMKNYLPEEFTIELDFWIDKPGTRQSYRIYLVDDATKKNMVDMELNSGSDGKLNWNYITPSDESRGGSGDCVFMRNEWNHLSVSFNKRAFKAYVNGVRIANVPAIGKPSKFSFWGRYWDMDKKTVSVRNVRIAKGAVPLYDRMMTDGKFITYGITFDIGKSTIKPESMGEINRIVTLLKENPDLKFSVEGHTDSTGSAATNQTLSEARSQAVVDKLVETGIARDRLKAAGKGQTSPIADNGTDEGRAKNRRVEFVKN